MDFERLKKFSALSLTFLILLAGVALVLIVIILLLKKNNLVEEKMNKFKDYQTLRLMNKDSIEYTVGMVRISRNIDDFEFEEKIDGSMELISNFGTVEYICTGKCVCDKSSRRTVAASRGLTYLLVAVSSLMAINLASKYFENNCQNQLKNICPIQAIRSEIDDCNKVFDDDDVNVVSDESEISDVSSKKFWCKGSCVIAVESIEDFDELRICVDHPGRCIRETVVEMGMDKFQSNTYEDSATLYEHSKKICSSIAQEGEVEIDGVYSYLDGIEIAMQRFQKFNLVPSCIEVMKYQVERRLDKMKLSARDYDAFQRMLGEHPSSWCLCFGEYSDGTNPTVKCRPTH